MSPLSVRETEYPVELRFITYLSPGIPLAFFEALVDHARRTLVCDRTPLRMEARTSGPEKGVKDPFSEGEADVGFMCMPSFPWLRELRPSPVELLGVAPVFRDNRTSNRPVYFRDVVVRRDGTVRREDLLAREMREMTYGWPVEMMVRPSGRDTATTRYPSGIDAGSATQRSAARLKGAGWPAGTSSRLCSAAPAGRKNSPGVAARERASG